MLFATLAGVVATLVGNYVYGENAFLEIIPMVRAVMDPSYLPGDLVAEAARSFSPRFYSIHLIAALATPGTLPVVLFLLTIVANVATAVVVTLFARDLFKSNVAGVVATVFAMSVVTFSLGATSHVFASQVNSDRLAWPLGVLAMWAAMRHRPVLSGFAAGVASLMHPVLGAEIGVLSLGTATLMLPWDDQRPRRRQLIGIMGGLAVFGLLLSATIVPYANAAHIPFDDYREIQLARSAQELLPSEFPLIEWIKALFFFIGVALAWKSVRRHRVSSNEDSTFLLIFVAGVVLALVGGFTFVVVAPVRMWWIANPWHRLTPVLAWLGLTVIAGGVCERVKNGRIGDGAYLAATGLNPVSTGLGHLVVWAEERTWVRDVSGPAWGVLRAVALIGGIAVMTPFRSIVQFALVGLIAVWLVAGPARARPIISSTMAVGTLAVVLVGAQTIGGLPHVIDEIGPEILPSQREGPIVDIGERAKAATSEDALIVIPPRLGDIRVTAERPVLVDYKAIPFQEDWMAIWWGRIVAAYGRPDEIGPAAVTEMDRRYRGIEDETLSALCQQYGARYAVLYSETLSSFEVVDANSVYTLVDLDDCEVTNR